MKTRETVLVYATATLLGAALGIVVGATWDGGAATVACVLCIVAGVALAIWPERRRRREFLVTLPLAPGVHRFPTPQTCGQPRPEDTESLEPVIPRTLGQHVPPTPTEGLTENTGYVELATTVTLAWRGGGPGTVDAAALRDAIDAAARTVGMPPLASMEVPTRARCQCTLRHRCAACRDGLVAGAGAWAWAKTKTDTADPGDPDV